MAWIVLSAVTAAMQMVVILPRVTVAVYQDGQVQKRPLQNTLRVSSMMGFGLAFLFFFFFLWVKEQYVGLEGEGTSSVAVVSLPVIHSHGNFVGCGFYRKLEIENEILQPVYLHAVTPHKIGEQMLAINLVLAVLI